MSDGHARSQTSPALRTGAPVFPPLSKFYCGPAQGWHSAEASPNHDDTSWAPSYLAPASAPLVPPRVSPVPTVPSPRNWQHQLGRAYEDLQGWQNPLPEIPTINQDRHIGPRDVSINPGWDSRPTSSAMDDSSWNASEYRANAAGEDPVQLLRAHPQLSNREDTNSLIDRTGKRRSPSSKYSSQQYSIRASATTIDVPLFLQPQPYDPETAPPMPGSPTLQYRNQEIQRQSPQRKHSIGHSRHTSRGNLDHDTKIARRESSKSFDRVHQRYDSRGSFSSLSSQRRIHRSDHANAEDSDYWSAFQSRPRNDSQALSTGQPISGPIMHPSDVADEIHSDDQFKARSAVAEKGRLPGSAARPPWDLLPSTTAPVESRGHSPQHERQSMTATDVSSNVPAASTPDSHETSNTSYKESEPLANATNLDAESNESFYWHSGRSSSEGEDDGESHPSRTSRKSSRRQSVFEYRSDHDSTSTARGNSSAAVSSDTRQAIVESNASQAPEQKAASSGERFGGLPTRSSSLSPNPTISYTASALGLGGPSDWEYFGDYEAEEVDDEDLYAHKPRAELPTDYERVPAPTIAPPEPPSTELSTRDILTSPIESPKKPLHSIDEQAELSEPLKTTAVENNPAPESKWSPSTTTPTTPHGNSSRPITVTSEPLPGDDHRPDLDEVIRAWSNSPYVGRTSSTKSHKTGPLRSFGLYDHPGEASLASTPGENVLGIHAFPNDAPPLPQLPPPVDLENMTGFTGGLEGHEGDHQAEDRDRAISKAKLNANDGDSQHQTTMTEPSSATPSSPKLTLSHESSYNSDLDEGRIQVESFVPTAVKVSPYDASIRTSAPPMAESHKESAGGPVSNKSTTQPSIIETGKPSLLVDAGRPGPARTASPLSEFARKRQMFEASADIKQTPVLIPRKPLRSLKQSSSEVSLDGDKRDLASTPSDHSLATRSQPTSSGGSLHSLGPDPPSVSRMFSNETLQKALPDTMASKRVPSSQISKVIEQPPTSTPKDTADILYGQPHETIAIDLPIDTAQHAVDRYTRDTRAPAKPPIPQVTDLSGQNHADDPPPATEVSSFPPDIVNLPQKMKDAVENTIDDASDVSVAAPNDLSPPIVGGNRVPVQLRGPPAVKASDSSTDDAISSAIEEEDLKNKLQTPVANATDTIGPAGAPPVIQDKNSENLLRPADTEAKDAVLADESLASIEEDEMSKESPKRWSSEITTAPTAIDVSPIIAEKQNSTNSIGPPPTVDTATNAASHPPAVLEVDQKSGSLADLSVVDSTNAGIATDPYLDLDPWGRASLNRFAAMLREEARAESNTDKLNIFNVFTTREARLRVILYGSEDELLLTSKFSKTPKVTLQKAPSQKLHQLLKATSIKSPARKPVSDEAKRAASKELPPLPPNRDSVVGPITREADLTKSGFDRLSHPKDTRETSGTLQHNTEQQSTSQYEGSANIEEAGTPGIPDPRAHTGDDPTTIPSAHARPRMKDDGEVKNYLINRRSIYRPFATQTAESMENASNFGREIDFKAVVPPSPPPIPALPPADRGATYLDKELPQGTDSGPHEAQSGPEPDLRRFDESDFDPLIIVLPPQAIKRDDPQDLADLKAILNSIPDDFSFIHEGVVCWDGRVKVQREQNERARHARQIESEQRIDALFDDHEIGYGDIAELEGDFKKAETARKAEEDRWEYNSFVDDVFDLVWARLTYEIDQLRPHYERYSRLMDQTVAGKDMFLTDDSLALAPTMSAFLGLHQKLEIRYQKAFEAVLERDRRLKKVETSPWYGLTNLEKLRQMDKRFEDAEKQSIIDYCQQRDGRANKLMDVLDQNTLRGVGANQDYMEAIMKGVRRIAGGRAFASLPNAGSVQQGLELVEKAKVTAASLASSSEQIVQTFHVADMLLNNADYEVSVAKAKVAKDMTALSRLKEERAKEDQKLMRDLEHRLALIREDHRRAHDEIIKLMLFLGVHHGTITDQAAPAALGTLHSRSAGETLDADAQAASEAGGRSVQQAEEDNGHLST